jgi:predicted Zn-dependent protease
MHKKTSQLGWFFYYLAGMKSFFADLFVQSQPIGKATVLLLAEYMSIGYNNEQGLHQKQHWQYKNITTTYKPAEQKTYVYHGSDCIIVDGNMVADVQQAIANDNQPWYKKTLAQTRFKLLAFLLVVSALLLAAYFYFVPYLSEQLARTMPTKTEISLGDKLFDMMVDKTKEDTVKSALVNQYFRTLHITTDYPIRITVINDATMNAFAIMGGHIVVYTGLLDKLKNHEELAALLGHEFTHIEKQHSTRSIFRALGSKVFLSLLFGKMGSVSDVLLNNADQIGGLGYARSLEKQADLNSLQLLHDRKLNCNGIVQLMERLKVAGGDGATNEILSSHPDLDKRLAYLQASDLFSKGEDNHLHRQLRVIFDQIKADTTDF